MLVLHTQKKKRSQTQYNPLNFIYSTQLKHMEKACPAQGETLTHRDQNETKALGDLLAMPEVPVTVVSSGHYCTIAVQFVQHDLDCRKPLVLPHHIFWGSTHTPANPCLPWKLPPLDPIVAKSPRGTWWAG